VAASVAAFTTALTVYILTKKPEKRRSRKYVEESSCDTSEDCGPNVKTPYENKVN